MPWDYNKIVKFGKIQKCSFIAKPKFSSEGRGIRVYKDYK